MRNTKFSVGGVLRWPTLGGISPRTAVPLASIAILLTACGGGGGGDSGGSGGSTGGGQTGPTPILQVGMQRQYTGTTTRSVAYVNPSSTQSNSTLAYNFAETVNVLQAPANSGAQFDVHANYNYTITQDPGTGALPVSEAVDTYENLLTNGTEQATSTVGEVVTSIQNDESANHLGNGPYTITTNTTYNYPTPIPGLTFPLQAGTSMSLPVGEVVNTNYQDLNASGSAPSNGSNVAYTSQTTKNNDGSFTTQTNRVNGVVLTSAMNSDGSGSFSSSGGTSSYVTSIGAPVQANGMYTIPVNYVLNAPSLSNSSFNAQDWYPGNGLPPNPLASQIKKIVGPVAALPAACNGAVAQPNMFEVDTTQTSLVTTGTYLVSTTQAFNANGVVVCSLLNQTNTSYDVYTGGVVSTTTTQTTTLLTAVNSPN
jgi:hypothetical protein